MIDAILGYRTLIEFMILHAGFALSQYVVLRAGVFSVATAGFASIGAYGAAILTVHHGLPPLVSMAISTIVGALLGILIAVPLARLRGVYQAIATLAFVQIVVALMLFSENITGGANGFNGIPKTVGFFTLIIAFVIVVYIVATLGSSRTGRAADAVHGDEAMAASLGVSVVTQQSIAFGLSGAIAGLFGALEAFHGYALDPNQFGFGFAIAVLSYVVLGGRRSVAGPIVGAIILVALPDIARPLSDYRMLIYGALLILVMSYLPRGVVDTILDRIRAARLKSRQEQDGSVPGQGNSEARP